MQAGERCYLMTSRAVLMPATFEGEVLGDDGRILMDVTSPNGSRYTCAPANIYDQATGRQMLREQRAAQLAGEGYVVHLMSSGDYRICCPAKHGELGGYRLRALGSGEFWCSCPAHEQDGACKHADGLPGLLFQRAAEAAQAGKPQHAQTYVDLAVAPSRLPQELAAPICRPMTLAERFAARGLNPDRDF